jgi:hypothetical protein
VFGDGMSDQPKAEDVKHAGMSESEMRERLLQLVFGGDRRVMGEFVRTVAEAMPEDTAVVLRGSAVTGLRSGDWAPFDADGPGTSDLDLTLVGNDILKFYDREKGFYISGAHSKPLSDAHPDIAPELLPLRRRLMEIVGRPVNIQGTKDWVMYFREHVMGQPYLTLVGKVSDE